MNNRLVKKIIDCHLQGLVKDDLIGTLSDTDLLYFTLDMKHLYEVLEKEVQMRDLTENLEYMEN